MTSSDTLIEHHRIVALTLKYAMALDTKDWDSLIACFAPDAILRTRLATVAFQGHSSIRQGMAEITAALVGNLHSTTNHQYEIDGDEAAGTCMFVSYQWIGDTKLPGNLRLHAGRYDDRLKRIDGNWLFSDRTINLMCEHEF